RGRGRSFRAPPGPGPCGGGRHPLRPLRAPAGAGRAAARVRGRTGCARGPFARSSTIAGPPKGPTPAQESPMPPQPHAEIPPLRDAFRQFMRLVRLIRPYWGSLFKGMVLSVVLGVLG